MANPGPARLEPLGDDEWPDEFKDNKDLRRVNVVRTLARHPAFLKPWNRFAAYILGGAEITKRETEILILRTGWNRQSDYEWGQHAIIGAKAGLSEDEILAIAKGPDAGTWSHKERNLLVAADELAADTEISDQTWDALAADYNERQLIDIIMTVGQYTMVCMALKSLRVQLEDGVEGLPNL